MENVELKDHLRKMEKRLTIIYGIGLLFLLALSILSNSLLKEQAAKQAVSLIKRTTGRGDFRETIYTLNDAKLDFFDAVVYYNEASSRLFSLPPQVDPKFLNDEGFLSTFLYKRLSVDLFFDSDGHTKIGSVEFIFGRFSHVPYAFLIWMFFGLGTIPIVRQSRKSVIDTHNRFSVLLEDKARADLAQRVRHDIRSPLGALQIATENLGDLSSKQRAIIHKATERISEIVGELELIKAKKVRSSIESSVESREPSSLATLVQEIIQEKRVQLKNLPLLTLEPRLAANACLLFACINRGEFRRALSNLIDNAIDACAGRGRIFVRLASVADGLLLEIEDDGIGIKAEHIDLVSQKGFTTKPKGSGLGLYYAKATVISLGGYLRVHSTEGRGTKIEIGLPVAPPPKWHLPLIKVPRNGTVVIVDDQEATHLSVKSRLEELNSEGNQFSIKSFRSFAEFVSWQTQRMKDCGPTLYLFDYDDGQGNLTGIDVVRSLGLASQAILFTGHFDSEEIQRQCLEQNLSLVPKPFFSSVPLQAI